MPISGPAGRPLRAQQTVTVGLRKYRCSRLYGSIYLVSDMGKYTSGGGIWKTVHSLSVRNAERGIWCLYLTSVARGRRFTTRPGCVPVLSVDTT